MLKRLVYLVILAALSGSLLYAEWCSGSGPGWFVDCWNNGCTISVDMGNGEWYHWNVSREQGGEYCDKKAVNDAEAK